MSPATAAAAEEPQGPAPATYDPEPPWTPAWLMGIPAPSPEVMTTAPPWTAGWFTGLDNMEDQAAVPLDPEPDPAPEPEPEPIKKTTKK